MTAEVVALTDEVRAMNVMLSQVISRLDRADKRQAELAADALTLAKSTRRHRIGSWVLAAVVVGLAVVGGFVYQDQVNERYRTCVRANEIRQDIRQSLVHSVQLLVNEISSDPAALAPVIVRLEQNLLENLPDRVCE